MPRLPHPLGTHSDLSNRTVFALKFQFSSARKRTVNGLLCPILKEMTEVFIHTEDTDVGNGIKFLHSYTEFTFILSARNLFND